MNLLTALIPIGLSMIMGGGAQQAQTGSTASSIVGKQGMNLGESFLVSMGAMKGPEGMAGVQPFTAPEAARPRSVAELTRGQPTTRAMRMDPVQRIVQSDQRVASAVSRMLTESSNQQMRDFSAKYATPVMTRPGRRTIATKQPGDIKVR
tara:strand:- start:2187 stop:2636 length:450 start_codon:yes stop_codon:yes gene_type:complete